MLRPRWRKVLRDLWMHRARTFMVMLAIVVGLTGAGAVLDTWSLLRVVTRESYLATNPASATLRVDSVDAGLLAAVRAMPEIRDAQARRSVVASVQIGGSWRTALLFASNQLASQHIGTVASDAGAWPPADGAFVIEKSSVEFAGASMGESIMLRFDQGDPVRLPITGVARDAGLAPGWMEHVVYGFVTPTTLARIGAPSTLDQLQIVTRDRSLDRAAVRRVALAVRDVAQARGHDVRAIDVPEPGRHIHAAQMDSLLYTMGVFGLLALLLSGFLVVNLVSAMLAGQLRDIGVMKAIGARPDQLARMYLGLALVLGLAASVMAIPLAAWIGRGYAGFSAQLLNFDIAGYVIPRWAFAVQLAAGMLLPVLAAAMPVVRGTRISVGTALRDVGIGGGATPAWLERVRGMGRPFLLSLRNAFRRRQRMALTLLTLAVGGAVFLGALDLRASIRRSVRVLYGEQMRFDMVVRLDEPHAVDSLEASASRIDGVTRAEAWAGARAALGGVDDLGESFPVTALPADSRLVAFPVKGGRWLLTTDSAAIVVNARLLEQQPSLVTGHDAIVLVAGRPMRWRVVGVVESGPTPAAYVTRATLARATGDWRAASVVIATEEQRVAQQSELIQRVRDGLEADGFAVAASQLMEASRRVIEDHLLMVAGFLVVMAQLTIIIGGLGLASTMSLAVLERTREIGVLRAIGASPRAILTIVQGEGMVVALLSWAIAIPLSLPVSLLLGQSFGRIMFPVPADPLPELSAVAIWLGVTVLVSVAACAWPASRAIRIPTSAALAYE